MVFPHCCSFSLGGFDHHLWIANLQCEFPFERAGVSVYSFEPVLTNSRCSSTPSFPKTRTTLSSLSLLLLQQSWRCLQHLQARFSPTAESFELSAQIGFGVVRGGPEVRFHEGSFHQVPPGFHEGCTRFREDCGVVQRAPHAVGDIT